MAQIQQAAERLERNFVDSRQLKVCATCFDLSVSLLRVLEMTITLVPEIFLDAAQPTSEMLLQRLAQVRVCLDRTGVVVVVVVVSCLGESFHLPMDSCPHSC